MSTVEVLGGAALAFGQAVPLGAIHLHDHANIFGANASVATGRVMFTLYSDPSCSPVSKVFASENPVRFGAGSGGPDYAQADSDVVPPNVLSGGTLYWQAIYIGDSLNDPSISPCTSEPLSIAPNRAPVTVSTSQTRQSTSGTSITVPWWGSGETDHADITPNVLSSDLLPPTGQVIFGTSRSRSQDVASTNIDGDDARATVGTGSEHAVWRDLQLFGSILTEGRIATAQDLVKSRRHRC